MFVLYVGCATTVSHRPPVTIQDGVCSGILDDAQVKALQSQKSLPDKGDVWDIAHQCRKELGNELAVAATVPGLLLIGYAKGTKDSKFVIGPSVGIGAGITVPLRRVPLEWTLSAMDKKLEYQLPNNYFAVNLITSANLSLSGLVFPDGKDTPDATTMDKRTIELGVSAAAYGGLELGVVSFARKTGTVRSKVALTLGLVLGYLNNSTTVGDAFLVGFQPGITVYHN